MSFDVRLSPAAEEDLERLFDFLLDRVNSSDEFDHAQAAIDAIRTTVQYQLAVTPYSFRKAGQNSAQRELIIPFGSAGYVALYEIVNASTVIILAVRHQREEDYR